MKSLSKKEFHFYVLGGIKSIFNNHSIMLIKHELQYLFSGTSEIGNGNVIQAIANYLRRSQKTSDLASTSKHFKSEEEKRLSKCS
jgi:hypothetical protein